AADCLVAPYRGEGFCLPVLEALACGVPVIIPSGGATDDFADTDAAYKLSSRQIAATDGVPDGSSIIELEIDIDELRKAMRHIVENRDHVKASGLAASARIRSEYSWRRCVER